jgi:DNA polymerase I
MQGKYRDAYGLLKALVYPMARQSGIRLDIAAHDALVASWRTDIEAARRELVAAGLTNPNSSKQKQQYLERVLPLDLLADWPTTPTGQLKTEGDTLLAVENVPTAKALAAYSRLSSCVANFGSKLRNLLIDGHLYPDFKIAGAETGRFTCSNPNIQNVPREGFKHLLLPPAGKVFVGGDLSQIELRVAGQVCGEEVINQAFREGRDLHSMMAANITGKPEMKITREERQMAKAANFGLLYGAGARTLQEQAEKSYGVTIDLVQAQEVKAVFHETYPALTEWQREIVAETNARGYSESRHVRLTRHYDKNVYTHAMNYPIQSSACEVLALAIIYLDEHAIDGVTISHHVHDELVLAAAPEQAEAANELLRQAFLDAFKTVFPDAPTKGLVEIAIGDSWAALKS